MQTLFCGGKEGGVQSDLHGVWGAAVRAEERAGPGPGLGGEAGPACRARGAFLWPAPPSIVLQGGAGSLSSEAGVGDPLRSTHWHPLLLLLKACRGALPVDTFVVKALRPTKAKTTLLAGTQCRQEKPTVHTWHAKAKAPLSVNGLHC